MKEIQDLTDLTIHDVQSISDGTAALKGERTPHGGLSSKDNLPHASNLRAFRGANLVTLPSKFGGNEPFVQLRLIDCCITQL